MPATSQRPTRTKRSTVAKATFKEPAALIEVESDRPQDHNGVPVDSEELMSNLPNAAPFKISRLHLSDGTTAYACRDCKFTGDARIDVQHHRNDEHGARYGKKTPRVVFPADKQGPDLVLPPRGDQPAPTNPMELTLGEILALAPTYAAHFKLIADLESERDQLLDEVNANRIDRATQHKIDVYDTLRAEVIDLRLAVQKQGNYDQIKAELYELRAWKKKIKTKLEAVGFVLSEEEQ